MNKTRRKDIEAIRERLETIKEDVEGVLEEEQDVLDNIPENLQESERYLACENAVENLEKAISSITDASEYLNKAAQ